MPFPPEDNNICSCCGTEFGYDDIGKTYSQLRDEWVSGGANWFSSYALPPTNWNWFTQLYQAGLISLSFRGTKAEIAQTENAEIDIKNLHHIGQFEYSYIAGK